MVTQIEQFSVETQKELKVKCHLGNRFGTHTCNADRGLLFTAIRQDVKEKTKIMREEAESECYQ